LRKPVDQGRRSRQTGSKRPKNGYENKRRCVQIVLAVAALTPTSETAIVPVMMAEKS